MTQKQPENPAAPDEAQGTPSQAGDLSSPQTVLSLLHCATYATNEEGEFLEPNQALAEFLLGVGKPADALRHRKISEFYVDGTARPTYSERRRAESGPCVVESALLELAQGRIWCDFRPYCIEQGGKRLYAVLVIPSERDEERARQVLLNASARGRSVRVNANAVETIGAPAEPLSAVAPETEERPYPDEYVVLIGSRVDFHSASQLDAMMRYAELLRSEEQDQAQMRFLWPRAPKSHEPEAEDTTGAPQIRGRALVGRLERRR